MPLGTLLTGLGLPEEDLNRCSQAAEASGLTLEQELLTAGLMLEGLPVRPEKIFAYGDFSANSGALAAMEEVFALPVAVPGREVPLKGQYARLEENDPHRLAAVSLLMAASPRPFRQAALPVLDLVLQKSSWQSNPRRLVPVAACLALLLAGIGTTLTMETLPLVRPCAAGLGACASAELLPAPRELLLLREAHFSRLPADGAFLRPCRGPFCLAGRLRGSVRSAHAAEHSTYFRVPLRHKDRPSAGSALGGLAVFVPLSVLVGAIAWPDALAGALIGLALPLLLRQIFLRLRHKDALGLGDVKLLAILGGLCGWRRAVLPAPLLLSGRHYCFCIALFRAGPGAGHGTLGGQRALRALSLRKPPWRCCSSLKFSC